MMKLLLLQPQQDKDILVGKLISRTLKGTSRIIKETERAGIKLMAMRAGLS